MGMCLRMHRVPPNFPHSEDEAKYLQTILASLTLRFFAEESLFKSSLRSQKSLSFCRLPDAPQLSELTNVGSQRYVADSSAGARAAGRRSFAGAILQPEVRAPYAKTNRKHSCSSHAEADALALARNVRE